MSMINKAKKLDSPSQAFCGCLFFDWFNQSKKSTTEREVLGQARREVENEGYEIFSLV